MKIPDAKKAVDAEWMAHHHKKTRNVDRVRPKAEVIAEAQKKNMSVHFGRFMDLCHLKHAELNQEVQRYKGRVVFRGDQVKDETVFTQYSQNKELQHLRWQQQNSLILLRECPA